jgi:hypothetical protein
MSWLEALVSVPEGHRSWWSVIGWWEARRFVFNAAVLPVGLVNLLVFAYINDVLLEPYLPFAERDWEPIEVLLAPVAANIAYTGGWITELLLRAMLGRDLRRLGPTMFCVGLGLSLLMTFSPPIHDGLRWAFLVARARRGP